MKTIVLFITIMASTYACSQSNVITKEAFDSIKINELTFADLQNCNGDLKILTPHFGNLVKSNINEKIGIRGYTFDGFRVGFRGGLPGFRILNKNVSMTIQGITFTIGDNISVLGSNIVFNSDLDGSKSILYQFCVGCNDFIAIDFDQQTKIITDIYYIDMT